MNIKEIIKKNAPTIVLEWLTGMMNYFRRQLYLFEDSLPKVILEQIIKFRLGKSKFDIKPTNQEFSYFTTLRNSEYLGIDDLKAIQLQKLKKLIEYAYEHVPYYTDTMNSLGLEPSDFNCLDDLTKLPVISKETIKREPEKFISKFYGGMSDSRLTKITTGGSTGAPMAYFFDEHMVGVRQAHWWRWSKFAGVDLYKDRMIYIGGDVESQYRSPNKFKGVYNSTRNRLFLTANAMSNQVIDRYIKSMIEFKGDYLRGYASAAYLLAVRLNERNIRIPLKAVLTSSDALYPQYRAAIEEAFMCEVFDHYGQNEDILTSTECEYHSGFHINVESCIAETVDSDNQINKKNGGFLVSTHLENYAMPLIRYKIGDVGRLDYDWVQCKCGRFHQKIIDLVGRDDEIIKTPDGRQVACGSMNQPMKTMPNAILKCQFIQERIDLLTVKIVPFVDWNEKSEKEFMTNLRKQVGPSIDINIKLVEDIPTRPNGKYQLIVSKIGKK